MKYSVRVTDVATGKVQVLDVEASSEEEAIRNFDVTKFDVTVLRVIDVEERETDIEEASRQRIARLRQQAEAIERAQANGLVPLLVLFAVGAALVVGFVMNGALRSSMKKSSGDQKGSKMTDAEKALFLKILNDD